MTLIAITGYKGAGKSEIAKCLIAKGFVRVSFADPLKAMLKAIGLTDAHLYGELKDVPLKSLGGVTPRHAMQTLGTEWGRQLIGEYIWTTLWWEVAGPHIRLGKSVVVDDMRFLNEAAIVGRYGGHILRVHRAGCEGDKHISETEIAKIPTTADIGNIGSLEDLSIYVDEFISLLAVQSVSSNAHTT